MTETFVKLSRMQALTDKVAAFLGLYECIPVHRGWPLGAEPGPSNTFMTPRGNFYYRAPRGTLKSMSTPQSPTETEVRGE